MSEETPAYKIRLVMCLGTEGVWVEEVPGGNSMKTGSSGFGALANNTIAGASWSLTKDFLKENAWKKNEDGSYLNEGQLRELWKDFAVPRYCESPNGHCKGCCAPLPGDPVFWSGGMSYKYNPATQEELEERGWLNTGPGGLLFAQARIAREDPSQLEGD